MFSQLTRIKKIKNLNVEIKEAKLKRTFSESESLLQAAIFERDEFSSAKNLKESSIVMDMISNVYILKQIEQMNQEINLLNQQEASMNLKVSECRLRSKQSYDEWQKGVEELIVTQKAVDKFDYVSDLNMGEENAISQRSEDLEIEEFKVKENMGLK